MSISLSHPSYEMLRKRVKENPKDFVALVGAGLAKRYGMPLWGELANKLIQVAEEKCKSITEEAEREAAAVKINKVKGFVPDKMWIAFNKLKEVLGAPLYQSTIKDMLGNDANPKPVVYDMLWQLGIKGFVSYNIDNIAVDSYAAVHKKSVVMATRFENAIYPQFLHDPKPFVFYPHGHIRNPESWVFTQDELEAFQRDKDVELFMASLFKTKSLIMVGFNPREHNFLNDIQKCSERYSSSGVYHFAVLSNPSVDDTNRLEKMNIIVIPYSCSDEQHSEIDELFQDILKYKSVDEISATAYASPNVSYDADIKDEKSMLMMNSDELRRVLNENIARIIPQGSVPTQEKLDELEQFYNDNVRLIHDAWLVRPGTKKNKLYGYELESELGRGAFGVVYRARHSSTGEYCAVKVLQEINIEKEYLDSFRRGIKSMRILSDRGIMGMVGFKDAYEIPACVFMELINGHTVRSAVEERALLSLSQCLDVLVRAGEIIDRAHGLVELVLHRDIKPENVMLRNKFCADDENDVVVLDFDLSWHKGALDYSTVHEARAHGYTAPEQTSSGDFNQARNVSVDTYGYGMLAYYILTREDPRQNEHLFEGFYDNLLQKISRNFTSPWKSLPLFLTNLIQYCTMANPYDRISFRSAVDLFSMALKMSKDNSFTGSQFYVLLWELGCRLSISARYTMHHDQYEIKIQHSDASKQTILKLISKDSKPAIQFRIEKSRSESDNRNVKKYLYSARDKGLKALRSFQFCEIGHEIGQSNIVLTGVWVLPDIVLCEHVEKVAEALTSAIVCLQLS